MKTRRKHAARRKGGTAMKLGVAGGSLPFAPLAPLSRAERDWLLAQYALGNAAMNIFFSSRDDVAHARKVHDYLRGREIAAWDAYRREKERAS